MPKTTKADVSYKSIKERLLQAIERVRQHGVVHGNWVNTDGAGCAIGAIGMLTPNDSPYHLMTRDPVGYAAAIHFANVNNIIISHVNPLTRRASIIDPIDAVSNWFEGWDEYGKPIPDRSWKTAEELLDALEDAVSDIEYESTYYPG